MAAGRRGRDKGVQALLTEAEALGCQVSGGGERHFKVMVPGGKGIVVIATSPSDRHGVKNARGRLRRLGVPMGRD